MPLVVETVHYACISHKNLNSTELKTLVGQRDPIFGPTSMDPIARRFHALVQEGLDYEQIAHMVETDGVDVDCIDQFENTALMVGALYGKTTACCLLLELGAGVNRRNRNGATALNYALSNGHQNTVLLLLRRGANPNNCAKNGSIPLLFAIQLGLTDLCRELLNYGADLDVKLNDGASAVFLACQAGNLDLLKLLAASGANLGMLRNDQTNALLIACQLGRTLIVRELLTCYKRQKSTESGDKKRKLSNHAEIIRRCIKKANAKGFADIVELLMEYEAPT
ncbi:hypothetical protein M3Y97_00556000 [Aphelenchoides bicaudatus]|nr:hypothetical protein M3Y97_00556000 [Aphelenchoides bicaudatus]